MVESPRCSRESAISARPDYLPTASLEALQQRAALLAELRQFFDSHGYWEVETPILSREVVVDAHLEPFVAQADGCELFLQTSPEFGMKRLLAAGAGAIYQVTRAFRRGECGRYHNPEFTMVEWYRVGSTLIDQMDFVEKLVSHLFARGTALRNQPFARVTYDEAFERHAKSRVLSLETSTLIELAKNHHVPIPESLSPDDRDGWLNLLLAEIVEPQLGQDVPTFVYDYPASQAALARIRPPAVSVAERFELYISGIELCNGYHELTDADELRRRMKVQAQSRAAQGLKELPADNQLLAAMDAGLPASAGVALGFDRLAMLVLGKESLAEVLAFPFDRA
ncbi:MAG: EF-P lysine aminoacylase EpmA [Planctomycetaceae bacterium]